MSMSMGSLQSVIATGSPKSVLGAQFRSNLRVPVGCAGCKDSAYAEAKVKSVNRKLKLQILKLEEELKNQSSIRKVEDLLFSSAEQTKSSEVIELQKRIVEFNKLNREKQDDVDLLKKQLIELRRKFEHTISMLQSEVGDFSSKLSITKEQLEGEKIAKDFLHDENAQLRALCDRLNEELLSVQRTSVRADPVTAKATDFDEVTKLRSELQQALESRQVALNENKETTRLLVKNRGMVVQLQEELDSQAATLSTLRSDLTAMTGHYDQAETSRLLAVKEKEESLVAERATVNRLTDENQTLKSSSAILTEETGRLASELESLKNQLQLLAEQKELDNKTALANLEKAVHSSVRLCIVAPTVNVNINDERLTSKPTFPVEKLSNFMAGLLNEYTTLYKQEASDVSPDGKTPIKEWLEVIQVVVTILLHHIES
jgi:hypothetical protein